MRGALVIGASAAGLQAALDLADSGIQVHLVEPSPFLGSGTAWGLPQALFSTRLLEAAKHPNITTWTNSRVNRVEGRSKDLRVELRQHPRYVDLARCTACGDCVQACPVTVPGSGTRAIHLPAGGGQPGCAAIAKLGKPPCSNTCPGGIHVQGYVALTAEGRFQEALDLIRAAIPFPGICGRICTHPCEVNCRRAEVDKPVAIRLLKRFLSDWELAQPGGAGPAAPLPSTSQGRVAVVGAGPGGMATADQLARLGYRVTVFEKLPVIGGMMTVGIPEYRLPRDVIAREYRHIQDLGVEIRLNTAVGPSGHLSLDDLFAHGYGAVCLAIGAHRSHSLRVPGEDLPGVVQGIELLRAISLSQQLDNPESAGLLRRLLHRGTGTRAAVLGGGNTAMDVARSLLRFGLRDVCILYRRTRTEMPAMPEEVEDAEREGVAIQLLVSPLRVLGDPEAGVIGLECLRMKLGEPDASGRRRPVPIAGSEFVLDLDLVVLAIGQAPDLALLGPDLGLATTREERINVDAVTFMTNRPGLFACGDAVTTDKMAVIEAIGMGKRAAAAIDAYLQGRQPTEEAVDAREVPIARRELSPDELAPKPRTSVPTRPLPERLAGYAEVELGYTAEQARYEAGRCLVCGPCSECLACERACKPAAIVHKQQETLATLDIGAIVYAAEPDQRHEWLALDAVDLLHVEPGDRLGGSVAAAQAMFELFAERQPWRIPSLVLPARPDRIGVFVCECGGQISDRLDTGQLRDQALLWPGVAYSQCLPFSCSDEAAEAVRSAAADNRLDRLVLAACSCCAIDQVCYSCTFQRVRCKDNLGVFARPLAALPLAVEFVNIREQCAWAHAEREPATAKAIALAAAAAAKLCASAPPPAAAAQPLERSALVLGSGPAARTALEALARQGIAARAVRGLPARVGRAGRRFQVWQGASAWEAAALVLAPAASEAGPMLAAFGDSGHQPRPIAGSAGTHRPGVAFCDPSLDSPRAAAAAAACVAAWLGQADGRFECITAVADPARCRACGTCVSVCEFGAPQLCGEDPARASWIDPALCAGCGTCAAHCPSGAIAAGYATDAQIEAMLAAVLAEGGAVHV